MAAVRAVHHTTLRSALSMTTTYPLPPAVFGVLAHNCSHWLKETAHGGVLVCALVVLFFSLYYAWLQCLVWRGKGLDNGSIGRLL
ncbi:hypothetical protein F4859DRAFT_468958 [Xylaria cf. heliscus]|nr:hypothetical protein F4859DRAFT_468958 [Xylaria cf. heliscus]